MDICFAYTGSIPKIIVICIIFYFLFAGETATVPKWLYHLPVPPIMYEGSYFSKSSTWYLFIVFYNSSSRWNGNLYGVSILSFLVMILNIFSCAEYITGAFWAMSFHIFSSFVGFDWVYKEFFFYEFWV